VSAPDYGVHCVLCCVGHIGTILSVLRALVGMLIK